MKIKSTWCILFLSTMNIIFHSCLSIFLLSSLHHIILSYFKLFFLLNFLPFTYFSSAFSRKELFDMAGLEEKNILMLVPGDYLLKNNSELFSYVNDILTASYINDLHTKEEKENITEKLTNEARKCGITGPEPVWRYYLSKVRRHFHCCICFSPLGTEFRACVKKFPALLICIVSFFKWHCTVSFMNYLLMIFLLYLSNEGHNIHDIVFTTFEGNIRKTIVSKECVHKQSFNINTCNDFVISWFYGNVNNLILYCIRVCHRQSIGSTPGLWKPWRK